MKTETLVFRGRTFTSKGDPVAGAHFFLYDCARGCSITEGFSDSFGIWGAKVTGEFESPYYIVWGSGPIYEVMPVERREEDAEMAQGPEAGAFIEFIPQAIRGMSGQVEEVAWVRADPKNYITRSGK